MPIRYLGIDIGQIQTLDLITARNEVQAKAVLYPEYVQTFARGTRFSVVTPQISAAGVEHLDTILQPYINVEPGRGNPRRDFELQEATITDSRYLDGLSIIVEAPEAGSLGIGHTCAVPWSGSRYGYRNDAGDIVRSRDDCDAHQ